MSFNWKLHKEASKTKVAQAAPVAQPLDKVQELRQKSPQLVKQMEDFVRANLPNAPQDPSTEQYRKGQKKMLAFFNSNSVASRLFSDIYYTINPNETLNEFQQRVTYEAPFGGIDPAKYNLPQQQNNTGPNLGDFVSRSADIAKADELSRPALENISDAFIASNEEFFEDLQASKKIPKHVFNSIGEASVSLFVGNDKGNAQKRWKRIFIDNPNLLPPDIAASVKSGKFKSVKEAIDYDIITSFNQGQMPSTIKKLAEMAMQEAGAERDLLVGYIITTAKKLSSQIGQYGNSMDKDLDGDGGGSAAALQADQKAENPAAFVPKISEEDLSVVNDIWKDFITVNEQTIMTLRNAKYPETDVVMIDELAKQGESVKPILDEAIHSAFSGFEGITKGNETIEVWNTWINFFLNNPELLPKGMNANWQQLQEDSQSLLTLIHTKMADPAWNEKVKEHVYEYAFDFVKNIFESKGIAKGTTITDVLPNLTSVKTMQRLGKMVTGVLYREYLLRKEEYENIQKNSPDDTKNVGIKRSAVGTSTRRYTMMVSRVQALTARLKKLANTNEVIWLHEETDEDNTNSDLLNNKQIKKKAAYRNSQNQICIGENPTYNPETKSVKFSKETPVTEDNFYLLGKILRNDIWVPKAIDLMYQMGEHSAFKKDPAQLAENYNSEYPLGFEYQKANDDYIKANPNAKDHLAGYRQALAQRVTALREGKGMTIQQLAHAITNAPKKRGKVSGARLKGQNIPTEQFLTLLEAGKPVVYSESDMAVLAEFLGAKKSDIYAPAPEYDPHNKEDLTNLADLLPHAFNDYGPYLKHKKRESIRRGMGKHLFDEKNVWFFLNLVKVHAYYTTPPVAQGIEGLEQGTPEWDAWMEKNRNSEKPQRVTDFAAKSKGKLMLDLTGGKPVSYFPEGKTIDEGGKEIQESLKPFKTEDPYSWIGKGKADSNIPKNKKTYHPSDVTDEPHPQGYEEKLWTSGDLKGELVDPKTGQPKTMDQWRQEAINNLNERVSDNKDAGIQEKVNSGVPYNVIANDIIQELWSSNKHLSGDSIEDRVKKINAKNQATGGKQYSVEEYSKKFVEDEIKNIRFFRENAKQRLDQIKLDGLDGPLDKANISKAVEYFLPPRVRNQINTRIKADLYTPEEMDGIINANIPQAIQSDLASLGHSGTANKLIEKRYKLDAESAKEKLNHEFRKENGRRTKESKEPLSLEDFCKNYVEEVVKLETYKRNQLMRRKEQLPNANKQDKSRLMQRFNSFKRDFSTIEKYASAYSLGRNKFYLDAVDRIIDSSDD